MFKISFFRCEHISFEIGKAAEVRKCRSDHELCSTRLLKTSDIKVIHLGCASLLAHSQTWIVKQTAKESSLDSSRKSSSRAPWRVIYLVAGGLGTSQNLKQIKLALCTLQSDSTLPFRNPSTARWVGAKHLHQCSPRQQRSWALGNKTPLPSSCHTCPGLLTPAATYSPETKMPACFGNGWRSA